MHVIARLPALLSTSRRSSASSLTPPCSQRIRSHTDFLAHRCWVQPVPHRPIDQREIYGALFAAAAATLRTIAADPRHLGADIGFIAVLHTWGQPSPSPLRHPGRWLGTRRCHLDFLPRRRVLSGLFRGTAGGAHFASSPLPRRSPSSLPSAKLRAKQWVVYAKPPSGPAGVQALCRHRQLKAPGCHGLELSLPGLCRWPAPPRWRGVSPSLSQPAPDRFVRIRRCHYGFPPIGSKQKLPLCRHRLRKPHTTAHCA